MGLFTVRINGVRYTHAQARLLFERMKGEYDKLLTAYNKKDEFLKKCEELREERRNTSYRISEATVKYMADIKRLKKENEALREQLAEANAEVEARLKQVNDLSGQIAVARKVLNDKRAENEELRKQLAKWTPKRGKGGRFIKN